MIAAPATPTPIKIMVPGSGVAVTSPFDGSLSEGLSPKSSVSGTSDVSGKETGPPSDCEGESVWGESVWGEVDGEVGKKGIRFKGWLWGALDPLSPDPPEADPPPEEETPDDRAESLEPNQEPLKLLGVDPSWFEEVDPEWVGN
jgi:hypothetical protein